MNVCIRCKLAISLLAMRICIKDATYSCLLCIQTNVPHSSCEWLKIEFGITTLSPTDLFAEWLIDGLYAVNHLLQFLI